MTGRVLLLVGAFAAITACAPSAPDTPDTAADRASLEAEAPAWFDHYNRGDADAVTNLYAEDAVIMPAGAPAITGRAAFRDYIAADIAQSKAAGLVMKSGAVTGVGVAGDVAWLSGNYSVADASGATVDDGKYLSVYQRTAEGWKLIRDIWNSDRAPAPAAPAAVSQ
jgi:ketosteroid isomerase-like protein